MVLSKILVFTFAFAMLCLQCCIYIGLDFILQKFYKLNFLSSSTFPQKMNLITVFCLLHLEKVSFQPFIVNTKYQSTISFFRIHIYFPEWGLLIYIIKICLQNNKLKAKICIPSGRNSRNSAETNFAGYLNFAIIKSSFCFIKDSKTFHEPLFR